METKASSILPLLDISPPAVTSSENIGFTGAYPPTSEKILLQYHGYHRYLQNTTNRQSSSKDAISLVIKDTVDWWEKSGIPLKSHQGIAYMVQNVLGQFNTRKKNRKRNSPAEVKTRTEFLESLKHTFWVVQPDYEERIKELYSRGCSNARQSEDWQYLERVRGLNRGATLGAFDKKLQRTKKRALKLQEDHEARKIKSLVEYKNSNTENEYEEDSEEDFEDYLPPAQLPIKKRKITPKNKKECLPNTAYLIADKAGISDRNLTQLAAAIKQGDGEDVNDYNLSVKTTARRRKNIRTSTAQDILNKQLEDTISNQYALHWDGKIIKSLNHVDKGVEHVAVMLTGTNGQEILLSIVGIEGPSTAENEAKKS